MILMTTFRFEPRRSKVQRPSLKGGKSRDSRVSPAFDSGRTSRTLWKRRPDEPTRSALGGRESRVRVGLSFFQAYIVPGEFVGLHLHVEVTDFGQEVILLGAVLGLCIARMGAQGLGALRDKVVQEANTPDLFQSLFEGSASQAHAQIFPNTP